MYRKACSYEVQSQAWIPHRFILHAACLAIKAGCEIVQTRSPYFMSSSFRNTPPRDCMELRPLRSFAVEFCGRVLCTLAATARMTVRILPPRCPKECTQLFAATKIQRSTFWAVEVTKSERRACVKTQSRRTGITRVSFFSFEVLEGLVQFQQGRLLLKQQCFLLAMRLFCCTSRYKVFATSCWQKMSEQVSLSLLVCRRCWYVQGHLHKRRRTVKQLASSCSQNYVKVLVVRSSWNATSAESGRDGAQAVRFIAFDVMATTASRSASISALSASGCDASTGALTRLSVEDVGAISGGR